MFFIGKHLRFLKLFSRQAVDSSEFSKKMQNLREHRKKGFDLEREMCYTIKLEYYNT